MRFVRESVRRFAMDPTALIADAVGLRVQAAQKRCQRRLSPRRGRERFVSARRFERQPIEVRRDITFESVDTEVVVTERVDDDQDRRRRIGQRSRDPPTPERRAFPEGELCRKRWCNGLSRIVGDLDARTIHLNELYERDRWIVAATSRH